jgi:hypothetical protein
MLKMSQGDLGKLLGGSFQQIQKYETGINRMSAALMGCPWVVSSASTLDLLTTRYQRPSAAVRSKRHR